MNADTGGLPESVVRKEKVLSTTRCKFYCQGVTKRVYKEAGKPDSFTYEAEFSVVCDGSAENKEFFKWSPWGSLKLGTHREDRFVPGKEYYLDITGAD